MRVKKVGWGEYLGGFGSLVGFRFKLQIQKINDSFYKGSGLMKVMFYEDQFSIYIWDRLGGKDVKQGI